MNKSALATLPLAKGKDIHNRVAKLGLYKECLALAFLIKDKLIQEHTLNEIRTKWLEHRGDGGYSLQVQIASCLDRIAYGRLCHTKSRQRLITDASTRYDWGVVNPMENHQRLIHRREAKKSPDASSHGSGKRDFVPMTNWGIGNMDPEAVAKHKELTDRQHFMGPHWRNRPKPMVLEELSFEEQVHVQFQKKPKMRKTPKKHY
ncbi:unnamed protein product [Phytomonas sp. EM1]|nr:unnamed protein product [Phytomonas sp. EM1]|eukprot:CCW59881.1 unnamed protein product [Phytomonas sp. isolate EM1]